MARSMLVLMEPLPQLDLIELAQQLEHYNLQLLYALEAAPDTLTWQERTSALQWIGMVRLARKYAIIIDIQVLRFLRATLLLESMAVRLYPRIDFVRQYRRFEQYRAEQARRRRTDDALDRMDGKDNGQLIIRLDRILYTVESFFARTSRSLSLPSVNFNALMTKWSFAVYMFVRFSAEVLGVTLVAALLAGLRRYAAGEVLVDGYAVLRSVIANPIYHFIVLTLVFIRGRTVLFRLDDKEV
jgi:hypothetical protein